MQISDKSITKASESEEESPQIHPVQPRPFQKRYGKLHVLYCKGVHLLSLGPDYICFLIAFIVFAGIGILLTRFVFLSEPEKPFFCYFTLFFSLFQSGSYFLCATTDPGVMIPGRNLPSDDEEDKVTRYCKKCGIFMVRNSYHCRECDVCIRGYDHHCPWVSKCIGGRNLKFFYAFVASTMLFLLYSMFAFMYCIADKANKSLSQNLKTN